MLPLLQADLVWRSPNDVRRSPIRMSAHARSIFALAAYGPLLRSTNGRDFEVLPIANDLHPNAIYADDDALWMVGERGLLSKSLDSGATWLARRQSGKQRFHAIVRDTKGRLWVAAEARVLRALGVDHPFAPIDLGAGGRLSIYADPHNGDPWLYGGNGELRRWRGTRFERVQVATRSREHHALLRMRAGALVLAASRGTIYRSNDDGASWTELRVNVKTDLRDLVHTPFGLFVLGTNGLLAVSFDLARTFHVIKTTGEWGAASMLRVEGALLVATEREIYRIENRELGKLLAAVYAQRDPLITALATRVSDRDIGAELVLEDALHERGLW